MKTPTSLLFMAALLLNGLPAFAQPAADRTLSDNKKFSVEISESQLGKPLLSVFKQDGEQGKLLWSRSLAAKEDENDPNSTNPGMFQQLQRMLTGDGSSVVLKAPYPNSEEPLLRVITQKGGDQSFFMEDLLGALGDSADEQDLQAGNGLGWLELLLDSEKPAIYAFWLPRAKRWLALNLEQLELRGATTELNQKFNALGLAKARELAQKDQPDALKEMLKPLKRRASQIVPGVLTDEDHSGWFDGRMEAAYRFLAAQKKPEDKKYIERMLQAKLNESYGGSFNGDMTLGLNSRERVLGDQLLALWEGKKNSAGEEEEDEWGQSGQLHYFGRITGKVFLPFGAPEKAGSLWLYLIPGNVPEGNWAKDTSVLKAAMKVNRQMPPFAAQQGLESDPIDHASFNFGPVTPGEYRMKAVWDRRAPFAKEEGPESKALPEAGDYESAESKTIKLSAGQNVSDLVLECTNRVGKADEYYAADDLWQAKHPTLRGEEEQERPSRGMREKVIFSAPVADWIVSTNENKGQIQIRAIRLLEIPDYQTQQTRKKLAVRFSYAPARKKNSNRWFEGRLLDDHGCRFVSHETSSSGKISDAFFPVVPYGSKEIKLVLIEQNTGEDDDRPRRGRPRETVAASFTLKNLLTVKPEEWKPEILPAKRELDLVTVELDSINPQASEYDIRTRVMSYSYMPGQPFSFPGRQFQPPENKFDFYKKDKHAEGWQKLAGKYIDRWGNEGASLADFCREEELFKLSALFTRDVDKAEFLPEERWEVPLKKVPGAGESVTLGVTNELQGIKILLFAVSGTGEFTYRGGELTTSTNEISRGAMALPSRFFPNGGRPVEPKIYVKEGLAPNPYMAWGGPMPRNSRVVIASKIPHLVCRVTQNDDDATFALLEQDTSIIEPVDGASQNRYGGGFGPYPSNRNTRVKFLPLDFRPGDLDKKLTFIAQKARKAEFIFKMPKEGRPQNEE